LESTIIEQGIITEERKSVIRDSFMASVAYFFKACPENMNKKTCGIWQNNKLLTSWYGNQPC